MGQTILSLYLFETCIKKQPFHRYKHHLTDSTRIVGSASPYNAHN